MEVTGELVQDLCTYLHVNEIDSVGSFPVEMERFQEYKVRSTNHQELMNQLKTVNTMIQKAANLRVGQGKARVVTACRNAIKSNNINELFQILRDGGAAVAKDGNVGAMRG